MGKNKVYVLLTFMVVDEQFLAIDKRYSDDVNELKALVKQRKTNSSYRFLLMTYNLSDVTIAE